MPAVQQVIRRNGTTQFSRTLPTTDPAVSGALWNDGGTVKISAGGALFDYLRPGGADSYFRPDGSSLYMRSA